MIARFPMLVLAGGGLLGYIAGEMAVEEPALQSWIASNAAGSAWIMPVVGFVVVVAIGLWLTRAAQAGSPALTADARLAGGCGVHSPPMDGPTDPQ